MGFEFVTLPPAEQPRLIEFLLKSYNADVSATSFRPDVIHWKYFAEHPDWKGPRAFAIKKDGDLAAFAGVWPIPLATTKRFINGMHLNDWAASRSAVGAGVQLLRKAVAYCDVHLAIGGSEDTRKILPKMGYKVCGELERFVRVVRPWSQFRTRPNQNWKAAAKFFRNAARSLHGIPRVPEPWTATRVERFPKAIEEVIRAKAELPSPQRTAAGLNHLLACPAAKFQGFQVSEGSKLRGYFVLSQIGRQMRIAEMRCDSDEPEAARTLSALAARTAAADAGTCEVIAASTTALGKQTWPRTGFVRYRTDPIFCYDPQDLLAGGLDVNLADNDFCILSDADSPYVS